MNIYFIQIIMGIVVRSERFHSGDDFPLSLAPVDTSISKPVYFPVTSVLRIWFRINIDLDYVNKNRKLIGIFIFR